MHCRLLYALILRSMFIGLPKFTALILPKPSPECSRSTATAFGSQYFLNKGARGWFTGNLGGKPCLRSKIL